MANWLKLPNKTETIYTLRTLPFRERRWVLILGGLFIISIIGLGWKLNDYVSVIVPAAGGSLREGVIGTPLFINPVLAASDSDRDLTTLIYSGLMRVGADPSDGRAGGQLIPDLAEKYQVSSDGLTYTFTLKKGLKWQDGELLTTADIKFTVDKIQDPLIKSPRRASWEGVNVEVINPNEISFHLKKPYPSFLETATMGILPKHLWSNFNTETFSLNKLNTEAIGSGPYQIKKVVKNSATGIPEYYNLESFAGFALGAPYISYLRINFYTNENSLIEAYIKRNIDSLSAISAEHTAQLATVGAQILQAPLPRVFGVFFNHNQAPVLLNQEVRQALNLAIDRQAIIETTLHGYGTAIDGPLPTNAIDPVKSALAADHEASRLIKARQILENGGWTWNETNKLWQKQGKKDTQILAFTISTSDTPELKRATQLIQETWQALGAKIEIKVYEIGDLTKDIIRPRDYDALFFGQVVGRTPDLYSFWHSSQRQDPGNNIALYTNADVDKLLEQLRRESDPEQTAALYQKFNQYLAADLPAVFVYAPDFLYVMPTKVKNVSLRPINLPADRFLSIYEWYVNTDKIWKIFNH
jgi:peptide/nickel transport system substrate-binding protein